MKALVLAAGHGTRLRPYSEALPKALFPVAGRPLLERQLTALAQAGCEAVAVNAHHRAEAIEAFVRSRSWGIPVLVRREPVLRGTGGAIANLRDFWDGRPFFVINADVVHRFPLRRIWKAHRRSRPDATLVLIDAPECNRVEVDAAGHICGFDAPGAPGALAFSGVQVLEPAVLDFLPAEGFAHSIDAFREMIARGRRLAAWVAPAADWADAGTVPRYREICRRESLAEAWRDAFGGEPPPGVSWTPLAGDGSDRRWYRVGDTPRTLVLADHGLSPPGGGVSEAEAFVRIGRHLAAQGLPVPRIHFAEPFAGLVWVEDLGDLHLQEAARGAAGPAERLALYREAIDTLVDFSQRGIEGFDPAWCWQTPRYDRALVLERECRYFGEAFLEGFAGLPFDRGALASDFARLADLAAGAEPAGLMHRDFQSRNILLRGGRCRLIDFQGARIGPFAYDLASLLLDPYVGLGPAEREALLAYALERLAARRPVEPRAFRRGYSACAVARSLQMLGAFAFLATAKGKAAFARYIEPALRGLAALLAERSPAAFPHLEATVARAAERLRSGVPPGPRHPAAGLAGGP